MRLFVLDCEVLGLVAADPSATFDTGMRWRREPYERGMVVTASVTMIIMGLLLLA